MREKILELLAEICDDEIVLEQGDVNLFETGLLDSLDYMDLLLAIDRELGIRIAPSELTRDQVDTPDKLVELVLSRQ
ncbi:MAG: D-alanine--poly(phosphoribitol) ligase subunit 2 [Lachnospiraceae bacterium]|jgi:D-alanine--poly(phosphoribitol) ligase subunit 2|nr:D-alanine--poly(phosphoribitol) ligase subunit 2 [Lachnospiraceae bacterium]MCR5426546.1 D-alanine--poly(phosphoribitol) ligase subunit 2 [Lachnospiraceae bacterium]